MLAEIGCFDGIEAAGEEGEDVWQGVVVGGVEGGLQKFERIVEQAEASVFCESGMRRDATIFSGDKVGKRKDEFGEVGFIERFGIEQFDEALEKLGAEREEGGGPAEGGAGLQFPGSPVERCAAECGCSLIDSADEIGEGTKMAGRKLDH